MGIIEINNIRKEFGTLVAVNDISMSIEKGHVVGLIGPNGAGKTTLLRMLATLLEPTSGNAEILGYDLRKQYLSIRRDIGFLPDFFSLYNDLTLEECLMFFAKVYKVKSGLIPGRIDDALKFVDLEEKRNSFVKHLSRGMVQRMGVAAMLVHEPEILLLDEPASGLDPEQRIKLRRVLKRLSDEGKTTVISSHILTELSGLCSHIAIMNKGRVVMYGSVDQIQQKVKGSRSIIVKVLDDCERAAGLVKEFTGIETIPQDNTITVDIDMSLEKLSGLNTHLVKNGIQVSAFYEQKTDLEDIFMKIYSKE